MKQPSKDSEGTKTVRLAQEQNKYSASDAKGAPDEVSRDPQKPAGREKEIVRKSSKPKQ